MICIEDVREASMFFPEEGEVALLVSARGLLPYVRRELISMYGTPSTTGEVYIRFGGLKVYTLVDDSGSLERQGIANRVNLDGLDIYYVCQKGERIAPKPPRLSIVNDINLLSRCMNEADMWLYLADKFPVCFDTLCMPCRGKDNQH